MNELENVATFALREIDSMAREASHRDAAAAGENGGEGVLMLMTKLKDVLQAVQYSVMSGACGLLARSVPRSARGSSCGAQRAPSRASTLFNDRDKG
jgi:hypothetical protein